MQAWNVANTNRLTKKNELGRCDFLEGLIGEVLSE